MKTTEVIVEYVVVGVMFLVVLGTVPLGWWPDETRANLMSLRADFPWLTTSGFLLTVVLALAYSIGIVVEAVCLNLTEWMHEGVKKSRTKDFLDEYCDWIRLGPITPRDMKRKGHTGLLRFYVLRDSKELYEEIEVQHLRMRITRTALCCEVLAMVLFWIGASFRSTFSAPTIAVVSLVGVIVIIATIRTVKYRFERFDSVVERAYVVLMMKKREDR